MAADCIPGAGEEGTHALDPLRLTVLVHGLGLSGFDVDDLLQLEHGVCAEMSTDKVGGSSGTLSYPSRAAVTCVP